MSKNCVLFSRLCCLRNKKETFRYYTIPVHQWCNSVYLRVCHFFYLLAMNLLDMFLSCRERNELKIDLSFQPMLWQEKLRQPQRNPVGPGDNRQVSKFVSIKLRPAIRKIEPPNFNIVRKNLITSKARCNFLPWNCVLLIVGGWLQNGVPGDGRQTRGRRHLGGRETRGVVNDCTGDP